MRSAFLKLMLITNKANRSTSSYLDFLVRCVDAGVTSVQLREKNLSFNALLELGRLIKKELNSLKVPLIVNDSLALCVALEADGLHLGQADGDTVEARKRLGARCILGLSVNRLSHIKIANQLPVDYLGVGAIFSTRSKPNVQTIWTPEGLGEAVRVANHPIVAIGGINEGNALAVMASGASGIAAISVFHEALDLKETIQNLRQVVEKDGHNE